MINVQIVSFHCVLKDKLGKVISSTYNRDVLTSTEPPVEDRLPGLSRGLQNLQKGEKRKIVLNAAEAYGFYDTTKVLDLSREDLRENAENDLHLGEKVCFVDKEGKTQLYRVVSLSCDRITLDANHPLAGQDLVFEIEATDVREATQDEIRESNAESNGILLN